ncbi:hypothetical protein ACFOFO_18920 [Undibacterium arcticum]|uniref:Uncharacterized protein n=1 Tax=Undibacterium arcticum TaxID=1762892 RepID=A0ABV7F7E0_9BURK
MNTTIPPFGTSHQMGESATHPLVRSDGRLALSLLLAGIGLLRRRFAPAIRPNAPSGAFNYRF